MKKIFVLVFIFTLASTAFSQTIINRDKEIDQMVKEVSADSLQSYINSMVAFGTRNTLSTQRDPKRGIGACQKLGVEKVQPIRKTK
jgi:hypothetical protein